MLNWPLLSVSPPRNFCSYQDLKPSSPNLHICLPLPTLSVLLVCDACVFHSTKCFFPSILFFILLHCVVKDTQQVSSDLSRGENTLKLHFSRETASLCRIDLEHLKSIILDAKMKIPSEHQSLDIVQIFSTYKISRCSKLLINMLKEGIQFLVFILTHFLKYHFSKRKLLLFINFERSVDQRLKFVCVKIDVECL